MAKDLFGQELYTQPDIDGEDYAGTIVAETKLAILFDDGENQNWLPKAEINIEDAPGAGGKTLHRAVIVTIPDWLAREKELIE